MWKTFCRKPLLFQGKPNFKQQNQHLFNIWSVECVENTCFYPFLHFSVFYCFLPFRSPFDSFLKNLSVCSVFSFCTVRVFYEIGSQSGKDKPPRAGRPIWIYGIYRAFSAFCPSRPFLYPFGLHLRPFWRAESVREMYFWSLYCDYYPSFSRFQDVFSTLPHRKYAQAYSFSVFLHQE